MKIEDLFATVLRSQGFAVFEYRGDGTFRAIGRLPRWFKHLPDQGGSRRARLRLSESFPFVANFLIDAEKAWRSKSGTRATSGLWIERGSGGGDIPLECSAFSFRGRKILLIQSPQAHFEESRHLLQTGRESRLQYESFLRDSQKKEILIHCIIHDLSQPLTAMRGCFSSLSLAKLPRNLREFIQIGERQSSEQEAMIREIIDAFAAELSAPVPPPGGAVDVPDLAACATAVVRDFSAAFAEREVGLELDRSFDPSHPWHVVGDQPRLRRIFSNLVENALRHSPRGSTVTVGVADEGHYLRAFVDDQGSGLPQGVSAANLFRLLSKGKDLGGKAGIGLYFCKITVERWGGTVGCETRPEGGARFWFRIPRHIPKGPEPGTVTFSSPPEVGDIKESGLPHGLNKPSGVPRPSLRILLAEDTAVIRKLAVGMLRDRGHRVVAVCDGRKALQRIKERKFDVVLMDVDMPKLTGIEATRAIRQEERGTGNHLPVIGMSAFASKTEHRRCLGAGMDSSLAKPFRAEELYATVESPAIRHKRSDAVPEAESKPSKGRREDLLDRFSGKAKLLSSLIRMFLQDRPKKVSAIRRAIARGDGASLASTAHALRGQVGIFFGEDETSSISRKLESMGRRGDLADAPRAFAGLQRSLERLCEDLSGFAGTRPPKKTEQPRRAERH